MFKASWASFCTRSERHQITEKRKFPIAGTDFFKKIIDENGYYIDKTDVIPWIMSRGTQCVLFTRPRRFGKSTMMSMFQAFWEYRIDRDGRVVDNRHYFDGLKVAQDAEAMQQLGAFPVITITLKDVIQLKYEDALGTLAFYHGMLLGLLGAANSYIESNMEAGDGPLDIAVRYKDSAFIIELKSISLSDLKKLKIDKEYEELDNASEDEMRIIRAKLSSLAEEALLQIDQNQYAAGFIKRYPEVKTVKSYGLAFCRKWVEIKMKA